MKNCKRRTDTLHLSICLIWIKLFYFKIRSCSDQCFFFAIYFHHGEKLLYAPPITFDSWPRIHFKLKTKYENNSKHLGEAVDTNSAQKCRIWVSLSIFQLTKSMKEQILLFNMLFFPFKSHVGFQSYQQFYFASLRHKTMKNKGNRALQFLMFLSVFHQAIFIIFHFKIL